MSITRYTQTTPTGGVSSSLLQKVDYEGILRGDSNAGYGFIEDFDGFGITTAESSNVGRYAGRSGAWVSYEDNSTGFSNVLQGGVLEYDGTTTDNLEAAIQRAGTPFVIASAAGKKMIFEVTVAKELITNTQGFFIGLMEGAAPQNSLIADAGNDIADVHALGFFAMDTDGDMVDFIYQDAGDAFAVAADDFATLVAATYVRLGFYYDGNTITPYLNGVEYPDSKISVATIAGSTFPHTTAMSPIIAHKQGSNVDQYTRVPVIMCMQEA